LAEEIKTSGPYDEVFIETSKRDDPDALLEAISGLYHIDPVTHVVSISDILNGEDGNVDITATIISMTDERRSRPEFFSLTAILMDATVTWNQTGQGFIDMGRQQIATYAGDAIISEWPQAAAAARRRLHGGARQRGRCQRRQRHRVGNGDAIPGPTRRRSIPTATSSA
jgi:hypothetical protein